jgi:hypothetical protein
MGWAKFDDAYHDNPKMLTIGLLGTGLHARAITYCSRHETDGYVPAAWVDSQLAELRPADRRRVLEALVVNNAFEQRNGGYLVHDYLKFNPSREASRERRDADRKRKGFQADSVRIPGGF